MRIGWLAADFRSICCRVAIIGTRPDRAGLAIRCSNGLGFQRRIEQNRSRSGCARPDWRLLKSGTWRAISASCGLSGRTASQQRSDLLHCRSLCCATPSILRRTEFHSRKLSGTGKNQPVVFALGPELEREQSLFHSCRRFAVARYWTSLDFAKPGIRTKLRQSRWLQSIARPERNFPARYGDQPDVRKHFPLPVRTARTALRLLATSWRRSNRR